MSRTRAFGRAGIAVAALAVLGADVFVLANRDQTTTVAVEDVVERYRRSTTTSVTSAAAAAAASETATTSPSAPPATRPRVSAGVPRRDASPVTTVPPAPLAFGRPKDGVYTYETTGGETVSLGGSKHEYPALTYATVQRRSGCEWLLEQPVVKEHVDKRVFCAGSEALLFISQHTTVSFFGQAASDETRCEPPQRVLRHRDAVGSRGDYVCRSANNEMRARVTRLGAKRIEVAGRSVEVEHVLIEGVVTGQAQGSSRTEQWWLPSSGLLVREVRSITSRAHEFGANIDYKEQASFHLRSLEPRT